MAATFAFFHRGLNGASYAVAGLHQGPHGEGAATVFDAEFTAIELKRNECNYPYEIMANELKRIQRVHNYDGLLRQWHIHACSSS